MANISAYAEKAMLDWILGGATPTQPSTRAIGLSLGSPTSTSGSECTVVSGYTRLTGGTALPFGPATSPGGSAFNTVAFTFGPVSTAHIFSGIGVWDTLTGTSNATPNGGNLLWYGLLSAPRTLASGDSLVIATSALTVSLA